MANIFHIERTDNKITLGVTGTTIYIGSHTASKILALDASKELESVTVGTGLNYTRPNLTLSHLGIEALTDPGADKILFWDDTASACKWLGMGNSVAITDVTLDTIQDIRTTASPTFVSVNSLYLQYTATGNIAVGDATTLDALDADPTHNIAIGNGAGSGITDGDNNIFIGYRAGYTTTIAGSCIAIGYEALYGGTSRSSTVAIGYQAMRYHNGGNGNTIIGHQAGLGDAGGAAYTYNVFIGEGTGTFCNDGGSNVIVGRQAGHHINDGTNNIFIGQMAGHTQVDNSNLLIIDNQERANVATELTNAILYGVMAATPAAQSLRINAGILTVTGSISSGTLTVTTGAYDALDVTGVNTVFLDCSGGAITIGGFVGGVDGQHLCIARLCASAANMTLEHIEGTGNQDIYLHAGADEVLFTEYGGWVLVCNGTSWFDTSHSKHV